MSLLPKLNSAIERKWHDRQAHDDFRIAAIEHYINTVAPHSRCRESISTQHPCTSKRDACSAVVTSVLFDGRITWWCTTCVISMKFDRCLCCFRWMSRCPQSDDQHMTCDECIKSAERVYACPSNIDEIFLDSMLW